MYRLFTDNKFIIYISTILISLFTYLLVLVTFPLEQLQIIRLTQIYSLLAVVYVYLALLIEPLFYTFASFPFRKILVKSQKAFGVSAFYFALLHASFAFFGQLGGFAGLGFLSGKYLVAVSLAFSALVLLFMFTLISFTVVSRKLPSLVHNVFAKILYLAGILILVHAVMLGTHFEKLYEFIPQLVFTAVAFLIFLEILRFDGYCKKYFPQMAQSSVVTIPLFSLLSIGILYFLVPIPADSGISFGIHSQHIQLAKEAQQGTTSTGSTYDATLAKIPGLTGDRTKRYSVDFALPENIQPNTDVTLSFKVYDASSGNQVLLFNKVYTKLVHLIIVDSELKYFNHIHPEFKDGEFSITTQFPKGSRYHLYTDFQPFGAIEQRIATTVTVGDVTNPAVATTQVDTNLTKVFENYEVTLEYPKPLQSEQISIGQQILSFTLRDAVTKQPLTNLKPYLDAYGHMVMINQKTYDYIHVHPNDLRVPKPGENGGPTVAFMPLGLYGPIKPGIYRVFTQFNPNNQLFTSDFTVEIK